MRLPITVRLPRPVVVPVPEPPPEPDPIVAEDEPLDVPNGMKVAAGWVWRLLVLCAGGYLLWKVLGDLSEVVTPLFMALLLTAALWPVKSSLQGHHVPRWLATVVSMLLLLGIVGGIFTLVGTQIASQSNSLADAAITSYQQLMHWLADGPLHLHATQINRWTTQATTWLKSQQSAAADYATTVGTQLGHFVTGLLLCLFTLFFFLFEGRMMARTVFQLVPRGARARFEDAGQRGWAALVAYVRAAVIVAACDGVGAGLGSALIGSNLFLAIGSLTFICAFIPLLGGVIAGAVATSVVLLMLGWVKAIIMLVVFVAVIEIEAHVLQPFLLGKAVSIHPLAVLYGIAIGTIVGGIIGALFAVPLMAFGNAFIRALATHSRPESDPEKPPPTDEVSEQQEDRPQNETKIDDLPPGPEAMAAVMEASAAEGTLPEPRQKH